MRKHTPFRLWNFLLTGLLAIGVAGTLCADVSVTVSGPGGSVFQTLPDAGGSFSLDMPLNRNAVNEIHVQAADSFGNTQAVEMAITQVSLDQIVVSQITSERLSTEEVEQLVADGTIDLEDPENFNVSTFSLILTIDKKEVPISVPIIFPKNGGSGSGGEPIPLPKWTDDGGGGNKDKKNPPIIIIFAEEVVSHTPGLEVPPIPGVIIIEGRIKSLKEFFSVRLLLMNSSGIFTLSNVVADIEFPDGGLSTVLPADGMAAFGDILPGTGGDPGMVEKAFIIRGDEIGIHDVRVNFGGTVVGPGISSDNAIPFNGSAVTDVEVKGPPAFEVTVKHPDMVEDGVPYDLTVDIQNTGELPALYASLAMDVSADAQLAVCGIDPNSGDTVCEYVAHPVVRPLGHIMPGEIISETFTVLPRKSGSISSCMGISDQNISLRVAVGNMGCVIGRTPPLHDVPDGIPTVSVAPANNTQGISVNSPVVAFFSELMNRDTIYTGSNGTFNVFTKDGRLVPGRLRFETNLSSRLNVIWQVNDGVLNRLDPGEEYTVFLSREIRDLVGDALFNEWSSVFKTTTTGINDVDPPLLSLSVSPPVNPNYILPGEMVRINAFATDQGSGVARVELRIRDIDSTNTLYTLVDQKSIFQGDSPPYIFALDSSAMPLGHTMQIMVSAYDAMGNIRNSTLTLIIAPTAVPPVLALPSDPTNAVLQGVSVSISPMSISGGVRRVEYYLDSASNAYKTVTLPPWQASLSTLTLSLTNHIIRAVAIDGLDQTGEDTYGFTLVENINMPIVSFPGSIDGETHVMGEVFAVNPQVEDDVGIRTILVYLSSAQTTLVSTATGPILIDTTNLTVGVHHLFVVATNNLGVGNNPADQESFLEFSIVEPPLGSPPSPPAVLSVSPPSDGVSTITGTSSNHARIVVTQLRQGIEVTVSADGSGVFSLSIPADAGDTIRLVAYNLASSSDPSGPTDVAVPEPPILQTLFITPASFTLNVAGAYQDLTVKGVYNTGATNTLTASTVFTPDHLSIASVNTAGRVVAVSRGNANITATVGTNTATASVFVDIVTLTNITVAPTSVTLVTPGATVVLGVTGFYNDGTSGPLNMGNTFVTGDPCIATVTLTGIITAVADGVTDVTVYRAGVTPVAVSVRVDTGLDPVPTAAIVSPAGGTTVEAGELVPVTVWAADPTSGVIRVDMVVSGVATSIQYRTISPALKETTQGFNFHVPSDANVGDTISIRAWVTDTAQHTSTVATVTLGVVDESGPSVHFLAPQAGTAYKYGEMINITVRAADSSGVTQVLVIATGAMTNTHLQAISPSATGVTFTVAFLVPYGVAYPDVSLHATAWDAGGQTGSAPVLPVIISDADVTPPATEVTAVSAPGAAASAIVTFEVTDGFDDLDHVEIFFRRNGVGTFNRYTDADHGHQLGHYQPSGGAVGTLTFDSTKMGGDGAYELYSVGVDTSGNRELWPTNAAGRATADRSVIFNAGTAWMSITTDTVIAAGDATYDDANLLISNAVVTVSGHHAFRNMELFDGATLTHPETTTADTYWLDIAVWTLTIHSNVFINLNSRGYLGGRSGGNNINEGRTTNNVLGSTYRSGGSYGGRGGKNEGTPNLPYGSLVNPTELGSGGSCGSSYVPGGDGGGRLHLSAVNVINDGFITCNGGIGHGNRAGGGSGGAVYLALSTFSGLGTVTANGGGNEIGGGGGRVAIHYVDISTWDTALAHALGGQGNAADGGNGTVFLKSVEESGGSLIVDGQGAASAFAPLPIPLGYVFDTIIIRNQARVLADDELTASNRIEILTGSIVSHTRGLTAGARLRAPRIVIDSTSTIDASTRGYRGGRRDGNNVSEAETLGGIQGSTYRSGGSYGGLGGQNEGTPNPAYGTSGDAVYLGSGGSCGSSYVLGGNGGGRITIQAALSLSVEGAIRADGGTGSGNHSGGGSGGSIAIETSLLRGGGIITADGGGNELGGGGGRIAIVYNYTGASGDDLSGLRGIHAFGGSGNHASGSAGTVLMKRGNQTYGDLYIDAGVTGATASAWTPLTRAGFGHIQSLTTNTIVLDAHAAILPGGLVGLTIIPNLHQFQTFIVTDNTATTLTVDISGGTMLTDVAAVGDEYAAINRFDNLFFRRGGFMVSGDKLVVDETAQIAENSKLTHYDADQHFESRLDFTVGTLEITTNSAICVDVRGYPGGHSEGSASNAGITTNHIAGSTQRSGGSYGGRGGRNEGTPNPTYGNIMTPAQLGSGGSVGSSYRHGGDGGGLMSIQAGSVINDGLISADGGVGSGNQSGGGSGGAIYIETDSISGVGTIRANGGGNELGGGGGRIAIRYTQLTFPQSHFEVMGGSGNHSRGGNGTLFLQQTAQTNGVLIVDGHDTVTPSDHCPIQGGYTFDEIILRNSANVTADAGLTIAGILRLQTNSILTHTRGQIAGLSVTANCVIIDATSAIDVYARGYRGGRRDGNNVNEAETLGGIQGSTYRSGGSYGGLGGQNEGTPNPVYGMSGDAVYLGSGGSGGSSYVLGGNGGGRITIQAALSLSVEGAIRADGGTGSGNHSGGGSGGSIAIETSLLHGGGAITANGGGNELGGGGGRIAVTYDTLGAAGNDFDDLRNINAFGGAGNASPGSAGTVLMKHSSQVYGDLYIDAGVIGTTATAWTPLTHVGFGRNHGLTANTLVLDGLTSVLPGGLVGLTLRPDINDTNLFTIVANTRTSVVVQVAGVSLTDIASAGDMYVADYQFDNVFFRRGGFFVVGDALKVNDTLCIDEYSTLTHFDATPVFESRLRVIASTLDIRATGAIKADSRGYRGGRSGANTINEGRTMNNIIGSTYRSGGSYGGLGGANEGAPNPIYGNAAHPVANGSGGSCGSSYRSGGDGGGWIAVYAATTRVDGVISAGGGNGHGNRAGGGSGGTIYIETGALSGSGVITANGGGNEVAGGGGRVAIYFQGATSDTNALSITSSAGTANARVGADGTVYLDNTYIWNGALHITTMNIIDLAEITNFHIDAGRSALEWYSTQTGTQTVNSEDSFIVEFCTSLTSEVWMPVTGPVSSNAWTGDIPMNAVKGFYRIRRE